MKIEITRPHPDYPLAWARVKVDAQNVSPEKLGFDLAMVLTAQRIAIIGPWELISREGSVLDQKAPVLLEDEHTPSPKKSTRRAKK